MSLARKARTMLGGRFKTPPEQLDGVTLSNDQRRIVHMAGSVLLDYPTPERRAQYALIAAELGRLPTEIAAEFQAFLNAISDMPQGELESHFTGMFDQKRKCCPYLTYYSSGDTRRRGMALVGFIEAYRAAGWEVAVGELPDYLPMVLEFSARSETEIAGGLLAAHRDGIEVLRIALESFHSPYARVLSAVCRSFPAIDDETRERYLRLASEGPPSELVGVSFLGALEPYRARTDSDERATA